MFSTPQAILNPQALILSLLWIYATSTASATVTVIAVYQEISPELERLMAIERAYNFAMENGLFHTSKRTTPRENTPAINS